MNLTRDDFNCLKFENGMQLRKTLHAMNSNGKNKEAIALHNNEGCGRKTLALKKNVLPFSEACMKMAQFLNPGSQCD